MFRLPSFSSFDAGTFEWLRPEPRAGSKTFDRRLIDSKLVTAGEAGPA
jgi:hypothetical protein